MKKLRTQDIPDALLHEVLDILGPKRQGLTLQSHFINDLHCDSLELVEITMAVEDLCGIPEITLKDADAIMITGTIQDLVNYALRRMQE